MAQAYDRLLAASSMDEISAICAAVFGQHPEADEVDRVGAYPDGELHFTAVKSAPGRRYRMAVIIGRVRYFIGTVTTMHSVVVRVPKWTQWDPNEAAAAEAAMAQWGGPCAHHCNHPTAEVC